MSRTLKIVLIVSVLLNLVFIMLKVMKYRANNEPFFPDIEPVNIHTTRAKFVEDAETMFPQLKEKKFLFINVWSTGSWASMHQMPVMDSLVMPLRGDFGYLFVSEDKSDYAQRTIRAHTQLAHNFNYLNGQENFLTSIYQEKGMMDFKDSRYRMAPMNLIIDKHGRIRYFDTLKEMVTVLLDDESKTVRMTDRLEIKQYQKQVRALDSAFREIK